MQTLYPHPSHYPLLARLAWAWCLYLYFHCFRQSDCLASWVCGLVSTRSTRDTQQSLLASASPKTATLPVSAQPRPGLSDLCQCDVTSWGRLCSWPQCSGGRGQFWEQQLGGAQPADAAWAGVTRNTRLCRQLRLAQTLPPQHFVPDCYWFLQNRVILLVMDSSSRSWRTSFKEVPSLSHHWSSETVFIERWDGKDAVQLISVCSLTRFFGKTFADTFILFKRRKE